MIKFGLIILLILVFFIWFCIRWVDDTAIQLFFFSVIWLAAWLRLGLNRLWRQMRLMLPIMLTLVVVYTVFGLIGIGMTPGSGMGLKPMQYWLIFGTVRAVLFLNTLLWVRVLFSFISMEDIESLPLSLHRKKGLLLGRILYSLAQDTIAKAGFYHGLIPSNQLNRISFRLRIKNKLAIVLCLLYVALIESKMRGELIDNRIRHCHKGG